MTTFLLDPRYLDDCVGDGVKDVEIEADAVVYVKRDFDNVSGYCFYAKDVTSFTAPEGLKNIHHTRGGVFGEPSLRYKKAHILFLPTSEGEKYIFGLNIPEAMRELAAVAIQRYSILYAHGKFLKGDAETLKNYGVTIKS